VPERKIANPDDLDQDQKHPNRARRAILTGGAVGLAAVAGSTLGRVQPASAQSTTQPVVELLPSGGDDTGNIQAAINQLHNAGTGGTVLLGPGTFNISETITVYAESTTGPFAAFPVDLRGSYGATVISLASTWTPGMSAIYCHRSILWNQDQNSQPNSLTLASSIRDLIIEGSAPSAKNVTAVGLDLGDGWGMQVQDVMIRDFYTSNKQASFAVPATASSQSIGFWFNNNLLWTEKSRFIVHTVNCDRHVVVDTENTTSGNTSHEYNDWDLYMYVLGNGHTVSGDGQVGMTWANGSFQGSGRLFIRGNCGGGGSGDTEVAKLIEVGLGSNEGASGYGYSQLYNVEYDVVVETNATSGNPQFLVMHNPENKVAGFGQVVAQYSGWDPSSLGGGTFAVAGKVSGDSVLTTPPSFSLAGSGDDATYDGIDCMAWITGGSVSAITLNGTSLPTSEPISFFLRDKSVLNVTYSGSPAITLAGLGV
jgi:hypothetical protein